MSRQYVNVPERLNKSVDFSCLSWGNFMAICSFPHHWHPISWSCADPEHCGGAAGQCVQARGEGVYSERSV